MITLYGFGRIFPEGHGETKDLWAQWALEELGLPYRVHALDHTGGELQGDAYGRISPFRQAPVIDDDGFVVADIMMAGVLRSIRKTDMLAPYPQLGDYFDRCLARPAWHRTLAQYAERLGVRVEDIR